MTEAHSIQGTLMYVAFGSIRRYKRGRIVKVVLSSGEPKASPLADPLWVRLRLKRGPVQMPINRPSQAQNPVR